LNAVKWVLSVISSAPFINIASLIAQLHNLTKARNLVNCHNSGNYSLYCILFKTPHFRELAAGILNAEVNEAVVKAIPISSRVNNLSIGIIVY
jgi:hypothetical protein